MSASTHAEDKETKAKELTEIAEGYRRASAKFEFLQVYCFPDLFRPYDLIATVGPDIMDKLVSHWEPLLTLCEILEISLLRGPFTPDLMNLSVKALAAVIIAFESRKLTRMQMLSPSRETYFVKCALSIGINCFCI